MPDEYIRRADALYAIQRQRGATRSPAQNRLLDLIKVDIVRAPAADVAPVVRCRDCKYVRPAIQACDGRQVGVWCDLRDADDIGEDDFCSQGERKDGGENDVSG